jgi:hypothetical protein
MMGVAKSRPSKSSLMACGAICGCSAPLKIGLSKTFSMMSLGSGNPRRSARVFIASYSASVAVMLRGLRFDLSASIVNLSLATCLLSVQVFI